MRTIASAAAIALVATTIAAAGGAAPAADSPVHQEALAERVALLDPAAVLAAIEAGEAFELPSLHGTVEARAGARVQDLISYTDVDADGTTVTVERPPKVWLMERTDGSAHGVVLAFNHTLRAWLRDPDGTTMVEPLAEGPGAPLPIVEYRVYRLHEASGPSAPRAAEDGGGPGTLSHIDVFYDVYAYVDPEYRDQYGSCCWADQVSYILGLLNGYFDDVKLEYSYGGGEVDAGFNTDDMDTAWDRIVGKSYNGADVKSYWSFRDFDGCAIGRAAFPGSVFMIQHDPDLCHLDLVPVNDAERAYFTARELGKNNNAHHDYHWSQTEWLHEHRSIMKDALTGHLHGCWSQTNMNRMSSYLGTSSVGTAC